MTSITTSCVYGKLISHQKREYRVIFKHVLLNLLNLDKGLFYLKKGYRDCNYICILSLFAFVDL